MNERPEARFQVESVLGAVMSSSRRQWWVGLGALIVVAVLVTGLAGPRRAVKWLMVI